jgi:hypothetical protein
LNRAFDQIPSLGEPQFTGRRGASNLAGLEHAARSENLARDIVSDYGAGNVSSIHYNRQLSSSVTGATDQRRHDVVVVLKDGQVILGEIASPSQTSWA